MQECANIIFCTSLPNLYVFFAQLRRWLHKKGEGLVGKLCAQSTGRGAITKVSWRQRIASRIDFSYLLWDFKT
jgi:hypothetical protein